MYKKYLLLLTIPLIALFSTGCTDASIVSQNLSQDADSFKIERRIVFYNGITDGYMLVITGKCSITPHTRKLDVICKTGPEEYKKHYLGLSDNVTYFVEQLEAQNTSAYHYKVVFKPQAILPGVDFRGDAKALQKAVTPDNND